MSSGGFSFPPPPPPPPSASSYGNARQPDYGQNYRGRGSSGNTHRGRGRGGSTHGSGRGGHGGGSHRGFSHMSYGSSRGGGNNAYGGHHTPQNRATQYGPPQGQPSYAARSPLGQPGAPHMPPQHSQYNPTAPQPYQHHSSTPYPGLPQHVPSMNTHPPQPPVMAPPMRMGFNDHSSSGGFYPPAPRPPNFPYTENNNIPHSNRNFHGPQAPSYQRAGGDRGAARGNKRPHSSAFGGPPNNIRKRPNAPPPVPSFGNPLPLPSKPPPSVDATGARKSKKKRRKHNQLGLTPKTEEHESSSEEDDADEETKLGQNYLTGQLKFTYKGHTSVLGSASDIAAWIEERKKKYPTQARIAERLKEEEARKQAAREAKEAKNAEIRRKKAERDETRRLHNEERAKTEKKEKIEAKEEAQDDPVDAAAKAKLKAEKLRRRLLKEEKRVAKAEADAEKARLKAEALKSQVNGHAEEDTKADTEEKNTAATRYAVDNKTFMANPESANVDAVETGETTIDAPSYLNGETYGLPEGHPLTFSSNGLPDSDDTSSSGSDSSSLSSSSDSDSAPEEATTKRQQPDRVAPPPRKNARANQAICREYAKTGHCRRGERCKFLHQRQSEQGGKGKQQSTGGEKERRKTLFQALVAQEREEENRRVMGAISWLGQGGYLNEPTEGHPPDPSNNNSNT